MSSTTFDSPGILAKSAWDIAALLTELSGVDPEDPITVNSKPVTTNLSADWKDFRIGVADKKWFWSIPPGFAGDVDDEERVCSDCASHPSTS